MAQENNIKSFEIVTQESTCQKRTVVCELFDEQGELLARESNRCTPNGGICQRLEVHQNKDSYDVVSHCNWTHAEIMAINALPVGSQPYRALLRGHDFYCIQCENSLKKVGIQIFGILSSSDHYKIK